MRSLPHSWSSAPHLRNGSPAAAPLFSLDITERPACRLPGGSDLSPSARAASLRRRLVVPLRSRIKPGPGFH